MSKRQLVEQLLREAGPRGVTTAEFIQKGAGSRFGGRIHEFRQELRKRGNTAWVEVKRIRRGSYRYTFREDSEQSATTSELEVQGPREWLLFVPPTLEAALHDWDGS